MSTEIERMERAVDRIGEYAHNNLVAVFMGLAANGMLSETGLKQAETMENMSYADIPDENKAAVRAACRVLLLDVLKDCVEKGE